MILLKLLQLSPSSSSESGTSSKLISWPSSPQSSSLYTILACETLRKALSSAANGSPASLTDDCASAFAEFLDCEEELVSYAT